jgi:hypothetical protein
MSCLVNKVAVIVLAVACFLASTGARRIMTPQNPSPATSNYGSYSYATTTTTTYAPAYYSAPVYTTTTTTEAPK